MFTFDGEKGKHNDALKIPPTSINLYTQTNKKWRFRCQFRSLFYKVVSPSYKLVFVTQSSLLMVKKPYI